MAASSTAQSSGIVGIGVVGVMIVGNTVSPSPSGSTGVLGKKIKRNERVIRMSDIRNRQETAEFLKSQLRLKHPNSAFVDTSAQDEENARKLLAKQERREKEMRRKADYASAKVARENAQVEVQNAKSIAVQNDNMRLLIMLASAV